MTPMLPSKPFARYREYLLPMLSLMGELKSAPLMEVKKAFEQHYGQFIPQKDRVVMRNGKERWSYNLEWVRTDLSRLELMDGSTRGVWAISEEGIQWLETQPTYDYANRALEIMLKDRQQELRGQIKPGNHLSFRWHGQVIHADSNSLLATASQILRVGTPHEAERFKDWYAVVDGRKVSVKWLFHLLTEADYADIFSYQARAVLRRLGIQVYNVPQKDAPVASPMPIEQADFYQKASLDFFQIPAQLKIKSPLLEQAKIITKKNSTQVVLPDLPASHFALRFTRADVEIGYYLQSLIPRVNHERVETLKPLAAQWSQNLGYEVKVENWGKRWGRVYMSTDRYHASSLTAYTELAQSDNIFTRAIGLIGQEHPGWEHILIATEAYTVLTVRFIETIYSDLIAQISRRKTPKIVSAPETNHTNDPQSHQLLDQKIADIRDFLAGRAARVPKDEELCDWIQLCYLFGLSQEGQQLFSFVQPQNLNQDGDWFYRRAKRYADLCRIKSMRKGE